MDDKKQEGERPNIVEQLTDPETGRPKAQAHVPLQGSMLNALDAECDERLKDDPRDRDARLDINVDETFPASDPLAISQPRKGGDGPPPGGKYD